ncbi:hypothetical protein BU16DRAFT_577098 [Lophium mytilinum]|uniref:BRCT domain-containing protein n=1 Tax=Lophium mytilinum TaxID=390894 RepID=A0A6A6RFT3_9PEZI|nr:hypothetical protein BU16DRAFT_577098 [Lophium mytilinum]
MERSVTVTQRNFSGTSIEWNLPEGQGRDIVECSDGSYDLRSTGSDEAVGSITVERCGVKLQAKAEPIRVMPKEAKQDEEYTINASSLGNIEIIFLRDGDSFFFRPHATKFHVEVRLGRVEVGNDQMDGVNGQVSVTNDQVEALDAPVDVAPNLVHAVDHVQVRSSASAADVVDLQNEDADTDQTEDEEAEVPNSLLDEATPNPTLARADELVEETPTSRRLQQTQSGKRSSATLTGEYVHPQELRLTGEYGPTREFPWRLTGEYVLPQELELRGTNPAGLETASTQGPFCTAPGNAGDAEDASGHNEEDLKPTREPPPRQKGVSVIIRKTHSKRSSPVDLDGESFEAATVRGPPSKRRRTSKTESQDSRIEEIVVDTTARPSKRTNLPSKASKTGKRSPSPVVNYLRSSQNTVSESQLYESQLPRIAFSNSTIMEEEKIVKFLDKHGGKLVDEMTEANILCVGRSELKKTVKLLLAVVLGIPIVTDDWLVNSHAMGRLLKPDGFAPRDHKSEEAWGFSMRDVLRQPQRTLFSGKTVCFTPALSKVYQPLKDIKGVALQAGAVKVMVRMATGFKDDKNTIVLAMGDGKDPDATALQGRGITCYTRDLLAHSILRGSLDLESDEFVIKPDNQHSAGAPKKLKRGRPRKS